MNRSIRLSTALAFAIGLASIATPIDAAPSLSSCRDIAEPMSRLDCYDRLAEIARGGATRGHYAGTTMHAGAQGTTSATSAPAANATGHLATAWKLAQKTSGKGMEIESYRPVYLIVRRTNDPNEQPENLTLGQAPSVPDMDPQELKFQVSLKSELLGPDALAFLSRDLRLWFAYTQQSNWQVFDTSRSRPFRDNNYEPELILTYDNRDRKGTYGPGLVNLGFVHQSNGRSKPESRGWNRVYLQGGWDLPLKDETESLSVLVRGWWSSGKADNPDINDYMGRGDVVLRWQPNNIHKVSLLARHNLRLNPGRGFLQADWAVDLGKRLPALHIQATSGYGESLIDYNYRQRTFGVGLSFADW